MQAGHLRHRITFQARDTTLDAVGQQAVTWTNIFTCWAAVEVLSGSEMMAAQSVRSEVTHKITVRYRVELLNPNLVAAMRISYAARLFNIQHGYNVDQRNRVIEIRASEGLNNG